jgi:hypothetical protein
MATASVVALFSVAILTTVVVAVDAREIPGSLNFSVRTASSNTVPSGAGSTANVTIIEPDEIETIRMRPAEISSVDPMSA